jgi:hypothetical protein
MYLDLGQSTIVTLTGGSTSTAVAASLVNELDDFEGVVMVTDTTDGNAPKGEWEKVTSYAPETGTFTLDGTLSAALAEGDTVAYITNFYPLDTMVEIANAGLRSCGPLTTIDTSLSSAVDQTEYELPLVTKFTWIWDVLLQVDPNDANKNLWAPKDNWWVAPGSTGAKAKLIFKTQPTASKSIMVVYDIPNHARVDAFDDAINEYIAPELAVAAGVERALRWQNSRIGGTDRFLIERWNDAKAQLDYALEMFPVWQPIESSMQLQVPDRGVSEYSGATDSVRGHRRPIAGNRFERRVQRVREIKEDKR